MQFNKHSQKGIVLIAYFHFKNLALCNYGHLEYTLQHYSFHCCYERLPSFHTVYHVIDNCNHQCETSGVHRTIE